MQLRRNSLQCSYVKNYPGVENQAITGDEMKKHVDKDHLVAFNTFEQLTGFVEGKPSPTPILNKIGLIVKTRNGITKARMILDTKQSGVKRMTAKTERVTLPRLFDAILRLLTWPMHLLLTSRMRIGRFRYATTNENTFA